MNIEIEITDKDIEDIKALMPEVHSPCSDRWVFWLVAQKMFPTATVLSDIQQQQIFAVLGIIYEYMKKKEVEE